MCNYSRFIEAEFSSFNPQVPCPKLTIKACPWSPYRGFENQWTAVEDFIKENSKPEQHSTQELKPLLDEHVFTDSFNNDVEEATVDDPLAKPGPIDGSGTRDVEIYQLSEAIIATTTSKYFFYEHKLAIVFAVKNLFKDPKQSGFLHLLLPYTKDKIDSKYWPTKAVFTSKDEFEKLFKEEKDEKSPSDSYRYWIPEDAKSPYEFDVRRIQNVFRPLDFQCTVIKDVNESKTNLNVPIVVFVSVSSDPSFLSGEMIGPEFSLENAGKLISYTEAAAKETSVRNYDEMKLICDYVNQGQGVNKQLD